jgi:hypothetical protein
MDLMFIDLEQAQAAARRSKSLTCDVEVSTYWTGSSSDDTVKSQSFGDASDIT